MSDETAAKQKPPLTQSQQQRADWAYGNTKLSNPDVTREMAEDAVRKKDAEKSIDADALCPKCGERGKWYSAASYRAAVEGGMQVGRENTELRAALAEAKAEIANLGAQLVKEKRYCRDMMGERDDARTQTCVEIADIVEDIKAEARDCGCSDRILDRVRRADTALASPSGPAGGRKGE